ncbi:transposase [Deinococcus sp. KSM4-11]|uniref:transposase n=1 Tax=Deinococcus sp. KSM4-11 TaxID=2568654 RepID=UPI001454CA5D|nr:transposase [Deinococcus sp. KSM4-11]
MSRPARPLVPSAQAAPDGGLPTLERRAAALLAYLSVEGPTPRSRLAGLLWPDVPESTARVNLRQTLRRLRQGGVAPELGKGTMLHLSVPLTTEEVLGGLHVHDYDDLPELADWLLAVRERHRAARIVAIRTEARHLEATGNLRGALDLGEVWLDLDPVSEEAWRSLMRLHHLLGDRAGALVAWQRCQATLRRELDVLPSSATAALAREIEGDDAPPRPTPAALPLSTRRPPRLIGRDTEWAVMEQAWADGQGIILSGEPGVGKTRLLRDFVTAHGLAAHFEGRPGDWSVPYSTHARTYSALLRRFPELALPGWVRRELARIVPELGEPPPPLSSDADKLRFYQAKTEVLRLAADAGMGIVAFDDLQFVDAASVEAGEHSLAAFWGDGSAPLRTIHAHRAGELSPELEARIDRLVSAGLAVRVRLEPLSNPQVAELLGSLGVADLAAQADEIARATGGNPLFVLETARHLLSTSAGLLPQRLGPLVKQRLERLSPAALSLARAAAVLGADLSPETVAPMLDCAALSLVAPWAELEDAQVLSGNAFTHDLLQEAVLSGVPAPLRALLHRQAAAALAPVGRAPARVAAHWEAGGEPGRAGPFWQAAAQEALDAFRLTEAAQLAGRAASAYAQAGHTDAAITALEAQSRALLEADHGGAHEAVIAQMADLARTPVQRARAAYHRAQLLNRQRRSAEAQATAEAGLVLLGDRPEPELRASLLGTVALSLWYEGQLDAAADAYARVEVMFGELGMVSAQADTINDLALVLDYQARRAEAAERYAQVEALFTALGQTDHRAIVLGNWGGSLLQGGRAREAVGRLEAGLELCTALQGTPNIERRIRTQLGSALTILHRFTEAQTHLEAALALAQAHGLPQAYARTALGDLWASLGRHAEAEREFGLADAEHTRAPERAMVRLSRVRAAARTGLPYSRPLAEAEELIGAGSPASSRLRAHLWRAGLAEPAVGLTLAMEAVDEARNIDHGGLEAAAHTRAAQALMALDRPDDAVRHANQARTLLHTFSAADLDWPEVALVHLKALGALGDVNTQTVQDEAAERLVALADHVPEAWRSDFLNLPAHRALLKAPPSPTRHWSPLTDAQWALVHHTLGGREASTGRPRRDTRAALDGVLWALDTGSPWHGPFPAGLPSAATCYRRYRDWLGSGALHAALERLHAEPTARALAARVLGRLNPSQT